MVFIAEIGDKTQLTAMTLAAENHTFLAVFIGAAMGLILNTLLSTLAGDYISKYISIFYIDKIAGIIFIIIGLLILFKKP